MDFSGNKVEINAKGLDNVTIENSETNYIEIYLLDINLTAHDIYTNEENETISISFENTIENDDDEIFRKFITKRLERASVLIKIPKEKTIAVFGETVGITSKSYQGNLNIYIDKGNIYLNDVYGNTEIKLFSGNIKGSFYQHNIDIISNKGTILIDNKEFKKKYKIAKNEAFDFVVNSINANVVLSTQKTQ